MDGSCFPYRCTICKKFFNARLSLDFHLKSDVHLKKLVRWKAEIKLIPDLHLYDILKFEPLNLPNFCSICKRQFSGPNDFLMHAEGKTHQNELRKRRMCLNLGPLPSYVQILALVGKDEKTVTEEQSTTISSKPSPGGDQKVLNLSTDVAKMNLCNNMPSPAELNNV